MTRRAAVRQADIRRQARGLMMAARDTGLPVGAFKIVVEDGRVELLPIAANAPSDPAADAARRMREAFGDP